MAEPAPDLVLRDSALLRGLPAVDLQTIIAAGRRYELAQGEFFFHQGEDSTLLYIILSGRVRLTQVTPDGQQVIVNYFGPGEGLGIIVALNNVPYPLSAEAIEQCVALGWRRETMLDLMQHHPQLTLNGLQMVGQRFAQMQNRFQELATRRVEQRVALALLRLVRQFGRRTDEGVLIDIPVSREDLAQMTGTNLYSVSRILSKWEGEGLISGGRRQITLKKAHELVVLAEDIPEPTRNPADSPDAPP